MLRLPALCLEKENPVRYHLLKYYVFVLKRKAKREKMEKVTKHSQENSLEQKPIKIVALCSCLRMATEQFSVRMKYYRSLS